VLLLASSEGDEDAEAAAVRRKRQGQRRRRTKESTRVVVFVAPRVRRVPEAAKAAVVERERGMIGAGLCEVLGGGGAGCRQTRKGEGRKVVRLVSVALFKTTRWPTTTTTTRLQARRRRSSDKGALLWGCGGKGGREREV